jgi:hypothetical protein
MTRFSAAMAGLADILHQVLPRGQMATCSTKRHAHSAGQYKGHTDGVHDS